MNQSDRRRFNIVLTEAGRRKVHEHASQHVEVINDLFAVLSQDEMESLSELLRALYRRAKTLKE